MSECCDDGRSQLPVIHGCSAGLNSSTQVWKPPWFCKQAPVSGREEDCSQTALRSTYKHAQQKIRNNPVSDQQHENYINTPKEAPILLATLLPLRTLVLLASMKNAT